METIRSFVERQTPYLTTGVGFMYFADRYIEISVKQASWLAVADSVANHLFYHLAPTLVPSISSSVPGVFIQFAGSLLAPMYFSYREGNSINDQFAYRGLFSVSIIPYQLISGSYKWANSEKNSKAKDITYYDTVIKTCLAASVGAIISSYLHLTAAKTAAFVALLTLFTELAPQCLNKAYPLKNSTPYQTLSNAGAKILLISGSRLLGDSSINTVKYLAVSNLSVLFSRLCSHIFFMMTTPAKGK